MVTCSNCGSNRRDCTLEHDGWYTRCTRFKAILEAVGFPNEPSGTKPDGVPEAEQPAHAPGGAPGGAPPGEAG